MKTYRPEELPDVLEITVTAEDVKHGERGNCDSCPAARALTREYPLQGAVWAIGYGDCEVWPDSVHLRDRIAGDELLAFSGSDDFANAVRRFDLNGDGPAAGRFPGTFTLTRRAAQ